MPRRFLALLPYLIIIGGCLLRFIIYLHDRSLILDEANVAKNLYERDFFSLFCPLNYAQFAPPLFLWAEKILGLSFGYSEPALRLFPLLSGCVSLWLLLRVLRLLANDKAVWYPLLLMAFGYLFIRYATELKQYSSDAMITLMLVWMTLRVDITQAKPAKFCILWATIGSLAIWCSMPAVFVLCGVAAYYLYRSWHIGSQRKLVLAAAVTLWVCNFLVYYALILRHDSSSAYLQHWHQRYFLVALPHTLDQLLHNAGLLLSVLSAMGGHTVLAWVFHICLMIAGAVSLFRRSPETALLLLVPVVCLLVACAMHKFTLLPRVILFALPLLLTLTAIGLQQAFALRPRIFSWLTVVVAMVCAVNYCTISNFYKAFRIEELKDGMAILQKQKITGSQLHVDFLIVPVYEYYTLIHPDRGRWGDLAGAHCTSWNTHHDSLVQRLDGTHAFLYEWVDEDRFKNHIATDRKYSKKVSVIPFEGGKVVVLEK